MKRKTVVSIFLLLVWLTVACSSGDGGGGGNGALPSLPQLLSPTRTILTTLTPTFRWTSNFATSYDFYLGQIPDPPKVTSPSAQQYTPASNLEPGQLYYWRVVGKNALGDSPSSVTSYFVTPEANPPGPALQIRDAVVTPNTQFFVTVKGWNLTGVMGIELTLEYNESELELVNIGGNYDDTFQPMGPMSGSLMIGVVRPGSVTVTMSLIQDPVDIPNNEILRVAFRSKNGIYPAKITIENTSSIIAKVGNSLITIDFDKSDQGHFLIGS